MKKITKRVAWILILVLVFLLLWQQVETWKYNYNMQINLNNFRKEQDSIYSPKSQNDESISMLRKPFPVWDTVSVEGPLTERVLLRFYNAETIHVMVIQDTSRVIFSDSVGSRQHKPESISLVRGHEALVVINRVLSVNIPIRDIHTADLYYDGWLNRVSVVNCKSGK